MKDLLVRFGGFYRLCRLKHLPLINQLYFGNFIYLFSDTKSIIVQTARNWILKECDVNKDIEITCFAQITLPDMQILLFKRAIRDQVKTIDGKAYYRFELALAPNQPIEMVLEKIRTQVKIDASILSLK